jgi:hypothetical protein
MKRCRKRPGPSSTRFAAWLEHHAPQLVELDEVVGYHLEQSFRYRAELEALDEAARSLAPRAAERLLAAAIRAGVRGDLAAAEASPCAP